MKIPPEEKLKYFGRVPCRKILGLPAHCPCWPKEDCCYCGEPAAKETNDAERDAD